MSGRCAVYRVTWLSRDAEQTLWPVVTVWPDLPSLGRDDWWYSTRHPNPPARDMENAKHIALISVLSTAFGMVMVYWFLSHLEREGTSLGDFVLEWVIAPIVLVLILILLLALIVGFIAFLIWLW